MENYLEFFSKVDSPPNFLKDHFDNFIIVYGLIINLNDVISKVTISDNSPSIIYTVEFDSNSKVNYSALDYINGSNTKLYGEEYKIRSSIDELNCMLTIILDRV